MMETKQIKEKITDDFSVIIKNIENTSTGNQKKENNRELRKIQGILSLLALSIHNDLVNDLFKELNGFANFLNKINSLTENKDIMGGLSEYEHNIYLFIRKNREQQSFRIIKLPYKKEEIKESYDDINNLISYIIKSNESNNTSENKSQENKTEEDIINQVNELLKNSKN